MIFIELKKEELKVGMEIYSKTESSWVRFMIKELNLSEDEHDFNSYTKHIIQDEDEIGRYTWSTEIYYKGIEVENNYIDKLDRLIEEI